MLQVSSKDDTCRVSGGVVFLVAYVDGSFGGVVEGEAGVRGGGVGGGV